MSTKSLVAGTALLSAALLTLGSAPGAAETGMTTKWLSTSMKVDECVRQAERALRAAQFTRVDIKGDSNTDKNVFGDRGNYSASVNCIEEKGLPISSWWARTATRPSDISTPSWTNSSRCPPITARDEHDGKRMICL